VDDEPDILEVIQEALNMKGFQTHTAESGTEAVEKAVALKPDLILMDVLLKNQNGMEVCAAIKSRLESFTPVILVTGQDDLRQKIAGARHAADDLLTKPFQMEELYARVTSMLRLKQLSDAVERLSPRGQERQ
jgi:DNA-binding response OmpR family regulator